MARGYLGAFLVLLFGLTTDCLGEDQNERKHVKEVHRYMTKREIENYFGVNSHNEVPDYHVTTPYQSDEEGEFLSFELNRQQSQRERRDVNKDSMFYSLSVFGTPLHVRVTRSPDIVSRGTMLETVNADGSTTRSDLPVTSHYVGHAMSDPGSFVALSIEDGLTGVINHQDETFFIRPMPPHLAKDHGSSGNPHIIYRRSQNNPLRNRQCGETKRDTSFSGDDDVISKRHKRATGHKVLEMAMIADEYVIAAYGEEEMARHMLLLAHIVSKIFHDESIGDVKVTPVIVKFILKKDGFGYDKNAASKTKIKAMEAWARKHLPASDKEPGHPDVAILLTRGGGVGLGLVGSTCRVSIGSTICPDIGLGSASIIAHEIAHTLGVGHDGGGNNCSNQGNIMATSTPSGPGAFKWSTCSKTSIQNFLSRSASSCLDDEPQSFSVVHGPRLLYEKLPGEIYNGSEQCKMTYGKDYFLCPMRQNYCATLWCTRTWSECYSPGPPQADGSPCGARHWCIGGYCVDNGRTATDGGWSSWSSDYSSCTKTCGGGVQWKSRTCTNPQPKNGGKGCEGPAKSWKICNPKPCPPGKNWRQIQCEEKNSSFTFRYWRDPCKLICMFEGKIVLKARVADGTRCRRDLLSKDVCIEGKCRSVGCDDVLESGVKRDRCGKCAGDSASCKLVKGEYDEKLCTSTGISKPCKILEVPVGATSVYVQKKAAERNLLSVQDKNGKYIFRVPSWSTMTTAAGTNVYLYHKKNADQDKIFIPGPTTELLTVVRVSGYTPSGVVYKMCDRRFKTSIKKKDFSWKVPAWNACSETCGEGTRTRTVECSRRDDTSYVRDNKCRGRKPQSDEKCNQQPCGAEWYTTTWSKCSRTCGKGFQAREIVCRRKLAKDKYEILPESRCSGTKPTNTVRQDCNKFACPAEWTPSPWSECSKTCGDGTKTRSLHCQNLDDLGKFVQVHPVLCHHAVKPLTESPCNANAPCPTKPSLEYTALGCFRDAYPRALSQIVANYRGDLDWEDTSKVVNECARQVRERYPRNNVFAIQFYGECWTDDEGESRYDMYGSSNDCWANIGVEATLYAYKFN